jgi:hypothetical protein
MKDFLIFCVLFIVISACFAIPSFFSPPPELSLVLNSLFWSSLITLAISCFLVWFLYHRGTSSQGALFFFALLLIISASVMYAGFEKTAADIDKWAPSVHTNYPTFFVLLSQFISYAKNIIAFGFGALGASVAANVITDRFKKKY